MQMCSLCVVSRAIFLSRRPIPAKVSFVDVPTDTAIPVGTETMLKCITSSRVEKCAWIWRPLNGIDSESVVIDEFPSKGDLGRDCSLHLPQVHAEKQGNWVCQVSIASLNTVLTSPSAKLTVFEQGKILYLARILAYIIYLFSPGLTVLLLLDSRLILTSLILRYISFQTK